MKRAMLSTLAIVLLGGGLALGQGWCPPPTGCPPGVWCPPPAWCPPPTVTPPCFTVFWVGEPILIDLVLPWGMFWCRPCPPTTLITGWSVEAFGGGVVFSHVFPAPVSADTKIVWSQTDLAGAPVAPGFYKIVVTTTDKAVHTYIQIAARQPGCFFLWMPFARPCAVPWCEPHLRVSRVPTCVAPCPLVWFWFPFRIIIGSGG